MYHNYILGGLAGVVIVTVVTALITDAREDYLSRLPIFVGGGAVTTFLLRLLAYWWYQILSGNVVGKRLLSATVVYEVPPLSALKSWTSLYQQMVLYGGQREYLERESARTNRKVVEWFAWANLLALFPLVNVWLYLFDLISQEQFLQYVRPAIVVLIVLMLARTYMLLGGGQGDYETQMLEGLGLAGLDGGEAKTKHCEGYEVRVERKGSHSTTFPDLGVPNFRVKNVDDKFIGLGKLPEKIRAALDLPKAKRWRGVRVEGGRHGIRIERQSRGVNMWLYDLWLAERLAAAVECRAAA